MGEEEEERRRGLGRERGSGGRRREQGGRERDVGVHTIWLSVCGFHVLIWTF